MRGRKTFGKLGNRSFTPPPPPCTSGGARTEGGKGVGGVVSSSKQLSCQWFHIHANDPMDGELHPQQRPPVSPSRPTPSSDLPSPPRPPRLNLREPLPLCFLGLPQLYLKLLIICRPARERERESLRNYSSSRIACVPRPRLSMKDQIHMLECAWESQNSLGKGHGLAIEVRAADSVRRPA